MRLPDNTAVKQRAVRYFLLLSAVSFILLFFYIPVFNALKTAFTTDGGSFSMNRLIGILENRRSRHIILFTVEQALLSTVFAILIGFPGAYILARIDFPGKSAVKAVSMTPFVLPSILVVLGFVIFFGNNGYLNRMFMHIFRLKNPPFRILYSLKAIILAHGFYNFPIAMRIIASLWEKQSPDLANASYSMGSGRIRTFFRVTLPQLAPAVFSAFGLIFLFCFSSFAIILVLGGGPSYTTIEVEIYRLAKVSFDLQKAGSFAAVGMFFSFIITYLVIRFQTKMPGAEEFSSKNTPPSGRMNVFLGVYIFLILLLTAAPVISVVIKSFRYPLSRAGGSIFSLHWYAKLFSRDFNSTAIITAVMNSLRFAAATVLISVPVGTVLSYFSVKHWLKNRTVTRILDSAFMLPMIVSSVILGLGYMIMKNSFSERAADSGMLIILAHATLAYPFVTRSVSSVLGKIKPSILHAASSLGSPPHMVFLSIELPLIKSAVLTGAAFAFAISMGELNATILLSGSNTVTIPLEMYRLIGSYNFYAACALGSVLMLLTAVSFAAMDRIDTASGRKELWG